jgi:hypothetical protein
MFRESVADVLAGVDLRGVQAASLSPVLMASSLTSTCFSLPWPRRPLSCNALLLSQKMSGGSEHQPCSIKRAINCSDSDAAEPKA